MAVAKFPLLGIRVEPEVIDRLDRIAAELTRRAQGVEIARTSAGRQALVLGVEELEKRLGLPSPDKP